LKEPTGWFAAGRSFRQALTILSDGSFKLFAYLCLEADRRTGRFETTQRELAQALGKSKRAIGTYVRELDKQGICRTRPGRNQFAPAVFEITETYWPYQKPASGSSSSEETRYVDSVRQAFLAVVCIGEVHFRGRQNRKANAGRRRSVGSRPGRHPRWVLPEICVVAQRRTGPGNRNPELLRTHRG
jgi:hypothetical protein